MADERELEKQLKVAAKTGNYVVGRREVQSGVKGSKLLVWSASANLPQQILDECRTLSVPAFRFSGNPVELGRACGIPFRVSVIALKSQGDADLSSFSKSSDYSSAISSPIGSMQVATVEEEEKSEQEPAEGKKSPTGKARKPIAKELETKKEPRKKSSKKAREVEEEEEEEETEDTGGKKKKKKSDKAGKKTTSPSSKTKNKAEEDEDGDDEEETSSSAKKSKSKKGKPSKKSDIDDEEDEDEEEE